MVILVRQWRQLEADAPFFCPAPGFGKDFRRQAAVVEKRLVGLKIISHIEILDVDQVYAVAGS